MAVHLKPSFLYFEILNQAGVSLFLYIQFSIKIAFVCFQLVPKVRIGSLYIVLVNSQVFAAMNKSIATAKSNTLFQNVRILKPN